MFFLIETRQKTSTPSNEMLASRVYGSECPNSPRNLSCLQRDCSLRRVEVREDVSAFQGQAPDGEWCPPRLQRGTRRKAVGFACKTRAPVPQFNRQEEMEERQMLLALLNYYFDYDIEIIKYFVQRMWSLRLQTQKLELGKLPPICNRTHRS